MKRKWIAAGILFGMLTSLSLQSAYANETPAEPTAEIAVSQSEEAEETVAEAAVKTVAGLGSRGHLDGEAALAKFSLPYNVVTDGKGNITVFDTYANAIRTIGGGAVKTMTGGTDYMDDDGFSQGFYLDEKLNAALMNRPADGVYNTKGELFFTDSANHVLRHIIGDTVYTFSGTTEGHRDGTRDVAMFNRPMAVAIDNNNNLYVADTLNHCIRKVDQDGKVTTVAGMPKQEGHYDGSAAKAMFRSPAGICVSEDGSVIYVSDTGNHMIRKIEDGKVTTVAGAIDEMDDGDPLGGFADGDAAEARFNLPRGITLAGDVLAVADSGNHMIRIVTKSGAVTTAAGNGESGDAAGDFLDSVLNSPNGICYSQGQLIIADTGNNKIKTMVFDPNAFQ